MTTAFRNSAAALLAALLALRAGPARAQGGAAAGGEVLVSFAGIQPSVAADSRGGFVLVWADEGQGGILASVLPKGESHPRPPFVVSAPTGRPQVNPDVAADAGRFAVVWQDGQDFGGVPESGGSRVVGRGFGPRAIPHFPEVRLSREEVGQQAHPQVAVEANGDFVAAWAVIQDEGTDVKAARFSGAGSPLGPEMKMKTVGEENVGVYVAAFPAGFAVGWVGMVGELGSFLAEQANLILNTSFEKEACPHNLAPTTSTTAQLALGDALAICLLECREFNEADFAKYHPGGSLGKKLYLKASDLASANEKPCIDPSASVKDVLIEISKNRLGAVAVVDELNSVVGVITDGDIRRMLENNNSIAGLKAEDIMGKNPKSIQCDALAVEALHIIKENNITQLLVLKQNTYFGIIHLHDLLNEGIV